MPLPGGRNLGFDGRRRHPQSLDGKTVWAVDRCGSNTCVGSNLDPILKFDTNGNLLFQLREGTCSPSHTVSTSIRKGTCGSRTRWGWTAEAPAGTWVSRSRS